MNTLIAVIEYGRSKVVILKTRFGLREWLLAVGVPLLVTAAYLPVRNKELSFATASLSYFVGIVVIAVLGRLGSALLSSGVSVVLLDEVFADNLSTHSFWMVPGWPRWIIVDDLRSVAFLAGAVFSTVLITQSLQRQASIPVLDDAVHIEVTTQTTPTQRLTQLVGKPVNAFVTLVETHDGELWAVDEQDQDPRYSSDLVRFGSELIEQLFHPPRR